MKMNIEKEYFVHQNIEHLWCVWNMHKDLIAVFHGDKAKENANNFCESANRHAALLAVAEAAQAISKRGCKAPSIKLSLDLSDALTALEAIRKEGK